MPPDLVELEGSLLQAVVDRRWDRLAEHLHGDFRITTAGWLAAPATKQEWIDEVAAQHLLHNFKIHSVEVHDLGRVCVALVLSTQWVTWKGEPFEGDFRYTDVWTSDDLGRWLLTIRHASLVPAS
jgi:ketosteroid isomerase-like protein